MKPLHEELRELREEQNLTLKDIAGKTRIRRDFLKRLEDGDYTVAPMPFVRAFFREYAEVLGVDANLAMAKLDKKIDTILVPKPSDEEVPEPPESAVPETDIDGTEPESATDVDEPEADADTEEDVTEPDDTTDAVEDEPEETQASLFDDEGEVAEDATGDTPAKETEPSAEEAASPETEDSVEEPVVADSKDDMTVMESPEPATESDEAVETVQVDIVQTHKETAEQVVIEENGKTPEHVRRPLVIEEENSLSNIVFAVIVVGILIIAGVLVFLNRGTLF